jgi:hypothetical protein
MASFCNHYQRMPAVFWDTMKRAIACDFSWGEAAARYEKVHAELSGANLVAA